MLAAAFGLKRFSVVLNTTPYLSALFLGWFIVLGRLASRI